MGRKERILIFQIGSLGDTVISMPCYREIARRHPNAERYLLTNFPIGQKMVQAEELLAPCGLIHGSVDYPMPLRGAAEIRKLYTKLRALRIDRLYYLTPEKSVLRLIRHYSFFKICGIADVRAVPWSRDLRYPRETRPGELWESEASRLLRTLDPQRKPGPPPPSDRLLGLSDKERAAADRLLKEMPETTRFIALSVGGKIPLNDWGDENWSAVLSALSAADSELGIAFIGSADERQRNEALARSWKGPILNSCGRLTPRETAALIERAEVFLGHDTGTLHLAAAVGTRIIGIYSARNRPGKWFSDRSSDRFFYHKPPCFGCELEKPAECQNQLVCMTSHSREEVVEAARRALADTLRNVANSELRFS
jgi:heptosyltransferase-3